MLSDNQDAEKIVHMRNILTEKRQWCKVNADGKNGLCRRKARQYAGFSALFVRYKAASRRRAGRDNETEGRKKMQIAVVCENSPLR